MVIVKSVSGKEILDSRKEKTILVSIKTNVGTFSASSPTGKSTGKYESKPYKKSLSEDIKVLKKFSDYFSGDIIEKFEDLRRIEDIVDGHLGANTVFALESAILKAISKEQKKEIWELINVEMSEDISKCRNFPRLVGNCIGGGKHNDSESNKSKGNSSKETLIKGKIVKEKIMKQRNLIQKDSPDFQEFLFVPKTKSVKESFEIMKTSKNKIKEILKKEDEKFESKKNDEDAWISSLNEKNILDILQKTKLPIGVDIAGSSFYKRKKYDYQNPPLKRTTEEQFLYISNLIQNCNIYYIEDPFEEDDFESFAKILKKFPDRLIVGDDLTVTNYNKLKKAIQMKSVNAIIVKPNQTGFLLNVKKVCELAKNNNIKIIFSHRSGETEEDILADLAFGFQADFIKTGITGKERESKIKRLIEIENKFSKT